MDNPYLQYIQQGQKDKLGWLDPALTAAGAIAGTVLLPGAGTAAGASLGHAVGGAAHSAANGDAQGAMQGAMGLPAFWQQFAPYIGTFAEGGPVPDQPDPLALLTPEMIQALQQRAQSLAGSAPIAPTPAPMQQASHPTLEALSSLMPTLLAAMPRPVKPNNRAIGSWLPAAGVALGAPAAIAQSKRNAANATISARNEQAQSEYDARQKAYEDRYKTFGNALITGAMKPQKEGEQVISVELAKRYGHPEWAGMTESQVRLKLAGEPKPDKPEKITPVQRLSFLNTLSDNIRQDKDISNFIVVRDNFKRINSAARAGTGVDDMSLIFAYMKVLDPTSVVRESEYKNAAQAIGAIPQLANIPENWLSGKKLTPAGRAGFVAAARRLYEQQRQSYRAAIEMYRNQAREYGVNPDVVIRNYEAQDFAPTDGSGMNNPSSPTKPKVGQRVQ